MGNFNFRNMNKATTHIQLLGYAITIIITCIVSYVVITNRVTALETQQKQQEKLNNEINYKLEKIYDFLINQIK